MKGEDRKIVLVSVFYSLIAFTISLLRPQLTDSAQHILASKFIIDNYSLPLNEFSYSYGGFYVDYPLFHIFGAVSKLLTGFFTLFPAIMGGISIFLTYKLIALWYNRRLGFLSALALALNPFFLKWSSKMYIGTSITAGFLSTFYLYFLYIEKKDRVYLYSAALLGGLTSLLKIYGVLAILLVLSYHIYLNRDTLIESIREILPSAILAGLISIIWPVRNILLLGTPFPKITGDPYLEGLNRFGRHVKPSNLHLFLPSLNEIKAFFAQSLSVSSSLVDSLRRLDSILAYVWWILPLSLFSFIVYGAWEERDNRFIWFWLGSLVLLYEVARILSGTGFKFKYRHFVTFTPIISLFAARAYEKLKIRTDLKKAGFLLLALALMVQMLFSVGVRTQYVDTAYSPLKDYIDENIAEEEVIYSPLRRNLAVQIDQKVVTRSRKPGYINPEEGLESQLRKNADWVITSDFGNFKGINSKLANMTSLVLVTEIDAREKKFYGEIGRTWMIYKVIKETEDN